MMDMTPLELLKEARALITPATSWTRNEYARTIDGEVVLPESCQAVCWCALGAVHRFNEGNGPTAVAVADLLIQALPRGLPPYIDKFNDHHTHAEVLALFDTAIAQAEAAA